MANALSGLDQLTARIEALEQHKLKLEDLPLAALLRKIAIDGQDQTTGSNAAPTPFVEAHASTVQGPGALGASVVYTGCTLGLDPGRWLIWAHATLTSQANADSKCISLYNATASATVVGSNGPPSDVAAVNVNTAHYLLHVLDVTAFSQFRIIASPNGSSQITIGYSASLNPAQRMIAVKLA